MIPRRECKASQTAPLIHERAAAVAGGTRPPPARAEIIPDP